MKKLVFFVAALLVSSTTWAQTSSCSKEQTRWLRQGEIVAVQLIDQWLGVFREQYAVDVESIRGGETQSGPFNRQSQEELAAKVLICAQQRLQRGFKYVCGDFGNFAGRTLPVIGNEVSISQEHFTFADDVPHSIAVLIHEATHKCGTNDATYFRNGEYPKNVGMAGWATIADTYQFWAEHGLCIPNKDCPR